MCMSTKIKAFLILSLFLMPFSFATDPAKESPTDESLIGSIDTFSFKMKNMGNKYAEIEINITGTASRNADHCGIAFVAYYKNGSSTYRGFMKGPVNLPHTDNPVVFIGTGENGSWETWKFYNKEIVEKEKLGLNSSQLSNISSFLIWLRVYGDKEEREWNQVSKNVTDEIKGELTEFYGNENNSHEEKFSYIYIIAILIAILIVIAIVIKKFSRL